MRFDEWRVLRTYRYFGWKFWNWGCTYTILKNDHYKPIWNEQKTTFLEAGWCEYKTIRGLAAVGLIQEGDDQNG